MIMLNTTNFVPIYNRLIHFLLRKNNKKENYFMNFLRRFINRRGNGKKSAPISQKTREKSSRG